MLHIRGIRVLASNSDNCDSNEINNPQAEQQDLSMSDGESSLDSSSDKSSDGDKAFLRDVSWLKKSITRPDGSCTIIMSERKLNG